MISLFKMPLSVEVTCCPVSLSPEGCAVPCGETGVLDKLHSGTGSSAVGHELGVNESTICCIQEKKGEIRQNVCEAAHIHSFQKLEGT